MRRLFLFAAFAPDGIVSDALVHQTKALAGFGDLLFYADSDISEIELEKLSSFTLYGASSRHGEYDFGSYKRCWAWAKEHLDLCSYDQLYLVNDSVYGPLFPMDNAIAAIENQEGLSGMIFNPSRHGCHVQSWFERVPKDFFTTDEFDAFLESVTKEESKNRVCTKYETGLTRLAMDLGLPVGGFLAARGNAVYNKVNKLCAKGLPFIKKSAFTRHNGSLGMKVNMVLGKTYPFLKQYICEDMDRIHGIGYSKKFLTWNPLIIIARYVKYLCGKIGK